ncbi:uncharacterized protein [Epargyreus clarus]|uniref:uncharacterized protein n=1 Tax=Epargyreus clarus TaxID=520877 RepID=UPI003C2E5513
MSVYLTKSMLKKLNKVKYPRGSFKNDNDDASTSEEHWEKLSMDSKTGLSLSKDMICRVCARSACTPLSYKFNGCDIMGALRSVANISISVDDSLPKFICTECFESLTHVMNFKLKCETTDKKFRKILNPEGDPMFHSYPYSKHDFQLILHQMKLKRMKIEEQIDNERKKREKMSQKKNSKANKEFNCSPCDMTFSSKEELVSHRRDRQCMRRACEVCGQLVVSIAHHMRHIHKDKVAHKCPTCGKEFPIITRLKNHMIIHSNTFNFFCDLCPYKSKYKYYLVMHMRTHTGEKPYKCSECPASFVNPSNLNKHKLTHQEKQFKCMLCEKAFRTNTALREHHDATHMNIKHTCTQCGRDFCYKADLRKHEVRSHNRTKRDYVGGEPAYKAAERLQRAHDDKWPAAPLPAFPDKDFAQPHHMYFPDVAGMMPHQPLGQCVAAAAAPLPAFPDKDFAQPHHMYFPDVAGMMPHQPLAAAAPLPAFPDKDFAQPHHMYFPDVAGMMPHQPLAAAAPLPAFPDKDFAQPHHMYFPDVAGMMPHQPLAAAAPLPAFPDKDFAQPHHMYFPDHLPRAAAAPLPAFPDKDFAQPHHMYFPDVAGMMPHQPLAQQHTVQISLPELVMKKDEVKMYETQQGMGYF